MRRPRGFFSATQSLPGVLWSAGFLEPVAEDDQRAVDPSGYRFRVEWAGQSDSWAVSTSGQENAKQDISILALGAKYLMEPDQPCGLDL